MRSIYPWRTGMLIDTWKQKAKRLKQVFESMLDQGRNPQARYSSEVQQEGTNHRCRPDCRTRAASVSERRFRFLLSNTAFMRDTANIGGVFVG
jgi:hypothetical protein